MYKNKNTEIPREPYSHSYFKVNKVVLKGMCLFFPPGLLCNPIPKLRFSSFGKKRKRKILENIFSDISVALKSVIQPYACQDIHSYSG